MKTYLVTGGAGFIGSNFIRQRFGLYLNERIVNVDFLTYAGVRKSLSDIEDQYKDRYFFEKVDICDYDAIDSIVKKYQVTTIINFAAESHNSYAHINPTSFYRINLMGTQTLLEVTRKNGLERFHHISTCEVYGELDLGSGEKFNERSPFRPNTPYNSSKACADLAVRAYFKTFQTPVTISNCVNNYGPYQFPEKLIPLFVTNLVQNKPLTLYKESQNKREWLHVDDHCRAINAILDHGIVGETYNIGSGVEKSIEDISNIILIHMGRPNSEKTYVSSRAVHDSRYLLDSSKIEHDLGWETKISFDEGIKATIDWYLDNRAWWEPLLVRRPIDEAKW